MVRKASALFDQFWPVLLPGFWAVVHAFQLLRYQFSGVHPTLLSAAFEEGPQRVAWMFVLEFIATVTLVWLQGRRAQEPDAAEDTTTVTPVRRLAAYAAVVVGRVLQLSIGLWVEAVVYGLGTRLWLAFGPLPEGVAGRSARHYTELPDLLMVGSLLTGWIPFSAGGLLVARGRHRLLPLKQKLPGLAALLILTLVAAWLFVNLVPRDTVSEVPMATGATCTVTEGDTKEEVVAKCGKPCGRGDIPKASKCRPNPMWPSGLFEFCSPSCDVYSTVAVCYGTGGVVILERMAPPGKRTIPTCNWSGR